MLRYGSVGAIPTSYLFVDGESFRQSLKSISDKYFEGGELSVNWASLRGTHRKAFYYDAVPVQRLDEDENTYIARIAPKRTELTLIERQPGYHVKTGDVQRRRTRGNEQKMVDVQLAVDALQAASRGLFVQCALFTGDLDFRPLVAALVDMGVDVTLYYPPGHTSEELLAAADNAIPITLNTARLYLALTDAQQEVIPSASFDLQTPETPPHDTIVTWQDERYGNCFVAEDRGQLRLVTEKSPQNPQTHRLILIAKRQEHLRVTSESDFGLIVPEW